MTITENINRIKQAKADIKEAIIAKGGTLAEDAKLSEFKGAIEGLPSGGGINVFSDVMLDNTGKGMTGVKHIQLDSAVKTLSESYAYGSNIVSINTEKIESAGKRCFFSCKQLVRLDLSSLSSISYEMCQECTNLENVVFGTSLISIVSCGFKNCKKLGDITFQSSPKLDSQCFANCQMRYVFFNCDTVPVMSEVSAFAGTLCQFVVPDALYDEWVSATNWSTYADRIIKASEYTES